MAIASVSLPTRRCHFAPLIPLFVLMLLLAHPAEAIEARSPDQAANCTTASPGADPSATVCASDVIVTTDGVSPDNRFSVSWISRSPEAGQVKLVGGDAFEDVRGSSFIGITHYVQVSNLQPNTAYQFDIISGANTYTNGGNHWGLKTGAALTPPSPDNIIGRVKNSDGSNATEAIVYAQVQRSSDSATSSLLSMNPPMNDGDVGIFHNISLSDARSVDSNSNYGGRFNYNSASDKVVITAVGAGGYASTIVSISAAHRVNVILTLGSGFVPYTPPTTTPIPPTYTLTPPPPSETPTLPTSTATAQPATKTATGVAPTLTLTSEPLSETPLRPTNTRPSQGVPKSTIPIITIVPAGQTEVALATLEGTEAVTPGPEITRLIRPTGTPEARSGIAGIASGGSILAFLAVAAFIGAGLLGVAAIFMLRKR